MPVIRPFNGKTPKVDPTAFIAETAVLIGDVEIGPRSSIWYGCVLRGDVCKITVGSGTNVQDGTVVHVNHDHDGSGCMPTKIGDDITIGHMALIHACTLETGSFVGMGAVVMDGVVVEGGGMVAAGALVTPYKRINAGELWGGSPAKLLRQLREEERKNFAYSASHYADMADA